VIISQFPYVDAGSNTSTIALRVVRDVEQVSQCLGVLVLKTLYGDLALQVGGVLNLRQ
jgi:hypothetical protein